MFWKRLTQVFTRDIPRIITKDIPKVITKDIPRIITKDIPALTKRESYIPEIKGLRKKVEQLETEIAENRKIFLKLKPQLASTRQTYQSLSENFDQQQGKQSAKKRFPHLKYESWDDTDTAVQKTLKDVESVLRGTLGFITLDLSEALWAPSEAKKEQDFLKQRVKSMTDLNLKIKTANAEITDAINAFKQAITQLQSEYSNKPLDKISELRNQENMQTAILNADMLTAKRMLAAGSSIEEIKFITNLDTDTINKLVKKP